MTCPKRLITVLIFVYYSIMMILSTVVRKKPQK